MIIRQNPDVSLKLKYPLVLRVSLVFSLTLMIMLFALIPKPGQGERTQREIRIEIETVDIPVVEQQIEAAKPPSRPSIPIEVENDDLLDDVTIEMNTDISSYEAWDAPPPPPEEDQGGPRVRFIPYDEPPEPIGGFAAIQRNVIYPEIAQEAGIEGTVVVQAFVNEFGKVTDCVILKGVPNTGLDEAAIDAIKKTKFKPAKQRDRNVGVYISIPVIFKLQTN
ncbi:MAG: energy transducer TonB [Candidatus Neomarinimicrobiota bacterium]|nr:MAG: energy transducer TonB [Candidatus Neomarinimicrobiota bacterium]